VDSEVQAVKLNAWVLLENNRCKGLSQDPLVFTPRGLSAWATMIDRKNLISRLEMMAELPPDWDGFGSISVDPKVVIIGKQLINMLPNSTHDVKIFVGVNNPGSLYMEVDLKRKLVEITILNDGVLHFHEIAAGQIVGNGACFLTQSSVEDLLS
jgi:hypothetical protein